MSDVEYVKRVLGGKAPTQKAVLKMLLRGRQRSREIAEDLDLTVNSVNIALHQLAKRRAVRRVRRGVYEPNEALICVALIELGANSIVRVRRLKR